MKLIEVSNEYQDQVMEYRNACLNQGIEVIHGGGELDQYECFDAWKNWNQAHEHQETLPPNRVRSKQFLFIDETRKELIGLLNLRLELNDYLLSYGGHIGYSIHPDQRGHGYAVIMLKEALKECKKLGLSRVLLICNKENIASAKTILHCGGLLKNEIMQETVQMQRYWITLEKI